MYKTYRQQTGICFLEISTMVIKNFELRYICLLVICGVCSGLKCYKNEYIHEPSPVVVTKTGVVVGKYFKGISGKESAAFLGIPFANPPLGDKRFQISDPVRPWNGTYFAKELSPACMQHPTREFDWIPSGINVSEDCLYLNIWLPPNCCCNREDKVPVMVWIHGGGYSTGSASMDLYDGSVLSSYGEVIVVSLNYRLGIFGFLNVGTRDAPGNMGLHDQYLALKWIQENIEYFGGNPNSITLFGESAGSFSVSLQMVSSFSRNLFHKAILQSGTSNQPIVIDNSTVSLIKATEFAKKVNCSLINYNTRNLPHDIVECLKNKSAEELSKTESVFNSDIGIFFLPSYGNDCDDCFKCFDESPIKTIQTGKFSQIPTLFGINQNEGSIFLVYRQPDIFKLDQKSFISISQAKQILKIMLGNISISSDEVFDYYIQNPSETVSEDVIGVIDNIFGDYLFKCPVMFFADRVEKAYFYWFNHRSVIDTKHKWLGVPHFAEIPYVFGKPLTNSRKYTNEDRSFSSDLMKKFTSFARDGFPTDSVHSWPRYSSSNRVVFKLNSRSRGSIQLPGQKACEFLKPYIEQ